MRNTLHFLNLFSKLSKSILQILFKSLSMCQHFAQTEVTMNYIKIFLDFITLYDYIFLPIIAAALAIFCLVNFCKNLYRRQNRKIVAVTRKICSFPHKADVYANGLPQEYKRQWRAYKNSDAKQPSLIFEFAPIKNRIYCLRLIILAAIVSSCYLVAFVFDLSRHDYLIFQIVFWLAFTLTMIADRLLFKYRESKAKKVFARLVNELNRALTKEQTQEEKMDDTVQQIRQLGKCEPTNAVFTRAAELLHNKGLNSDRTVSQQRKLNNALNGLLQSYSKTTTNA